MESLKKSVNIVTSTTGNVISDVLLSVLKVITKLSTGAEQMLSTLGNVVQGLGNDVKIVTHHTASGVGNVALTVAEGLGDIVERVPLAGKPSAFIVKKAGTGIHYIVLTVSDLIGSVGKTAGKGVKSGAKVIVFTLGQGSELSANVLTESNRIVQSVLDKVNKLSGTKSRKTKKLTMYTKTKKH
jgi:hypothetical protein